MNRIFKFIIFLIFSFSLGNTFALEQRSDSSHVLDRVVASVNNEAIAESELNRQLQLLLVRLRSSNMNLPPESILKKQLLDKMVLEKLQLQMAKDAKIDVDDKTLNQAIESLAQRDNLSVPEMEKYLAEQGVQFNQFKESVKNEMMIGKLQQREIGQNITVSSKDIEFFLKSPQGLDNSGIEYRVGHILIAIPEIATSEKIKALEKDATELAQQLKAGKDFGAAAMTNSTGSQALNGGDLGWRKREELPTLFAKSVPNLVKGDIIGPIRNESGYHIIKLLDKRLENGQTLTAKTSESEIRNKAMDTLYQRKFEEKLVTWLRRVKDEAHVQIYLNES